MNIKLFFLLSSCVVIVRTASLDFLFKEDFSRIKKYFDLFSVNIPETENYKIENISIFQPTQPISFDNQTTQPISQKYENSTIVVIAKEKGYEMLLKIILPALSALVCALCLLCYAYTIKSFHMCWGNLTEKAFGKRVRLDVHETTGICTFDINSV